MKKQILKRLAIAAISLSVAAAMIHVSMVPAFAVTKGVNKITQVSPSTAKVTLKTGQSKKFTYKLTPSKVLSASNSKKWNVSLYDGGWWQWSRDLKHNDIQMLRPGQAKSCSSFNYTITNVSLNKGETYTNKDIHTFPASGILPTVRFKSDNNDVAAVEQHGKSNSSWNRNLHH